MKLNRILTAILFITGMFYFTSCENNDDVGPVGGSILPGSFKVDIPSSLSGELGEANGRMAEVDTLSGNEIYNHLRLFVHVGEEAADIVESIILSIGIYGINQPMSLTFQGDDDGRNKNLVVVEDSEYDGEQWEFQLTITDAESEGNEDGGKAIQIFWNRSPVKGIAILKPYNIDRNNDEGWTETIFRIDYSEEEYLDYIAHMTVYITGLPMPSALEEPYAMSSMKMFAGKKGVEIDVYGNSDHPNAIFFAGNTGFNWSFVASGNESSNISVAEVGLPPSGLDEPSRETLLKHYSIKVVFTREINEVWPGIDPTVVSAFLHNTDAPGYFSKKGFVQGGTSPGSQYDDLETRMNNLSPYNPKEIRDLYIQFK